MLISESQKLNLILGMPLKTSEETIEIKQFTIKEIAEIGYDKYLNSIGFLATTVDDFLKYLIDTEAYMDLYLKKHELDVLDFFIMFGSDEDYKNIFEDSMEMLLGLEEGQIVIEAFSNRVLYKPDMSDDDTKLISNELFEEIITLIKASNGMIGLQDDSEGNPYDERAREILDKMKKNREKVKRIKEMEDDEERRGLHDIISAVTVKSPSTNKILILNFTLFQVYDEFSRLYAIENYNMSVKSLMYGGQTEISDWGKPQ